MLKSTMHSLMEARSGQQLPVLLLVIMLVSCLTLGGGGSPSVLPELFLQSMAAIIFAAYVLLSAKLPGAGRAAWLIIALVASLPAIQLIPLPAAIWASLPGRESMGESLSVIGAQDSWQPWSIAPAQTLASLLALGPPLLVFALAAMVSRGAYRLLLGVIIAVALAALALGMLQLAANSSAAYLYPTTHQGWITGFHANRNAAADLFLIAMLASAARFADRRWSGWTPGEQQSVSAGQAGFAIFDSWQACLLLSVMFASATIMTGSRAAIVLLVPTLVFQALLVARYLPQLGGRRILAGAATAGVVLVGVVVAFRDNGVVRSVLSRFDGDGTVRLQLWDDTRYAIEQFWPFGSGLGTFQTAFLPAERLEVVDASMPNRAHNDYLEFALEGGAIGLAILAAIAVLLVVMIWKSRHDRPVAIFAGGTLLLLAAHSLVDYPLRNMALAAMAGLAAGLLAASLRRHSLPGRCLQDGQEQQLAGGSLA